MKGHERRWERTDAGGWVSAPAGPPGRVTVSADGRIRADGVFGPELSVGAARWWALRLAEAAALAETLAPVEAKPPPALREVLENIEVDWQT